MKLPLEWHSGDVQCPLQGTLAIRTHTNSTSLYSHFNFLFSFLLEEASCSLVVVVVVIKQLSINNNSVAKKNI